jgi:hypothetical protein
MITEITDYTDLITLKETWNALLEHSQKSDNVFLRHEWFDVWWQAFGANKEMFVLLYHYKNKLLGIAPLMIFKNSYKGIPYKRLGFIEDPNAPSMNFIVQHGEEQRAIHTFLEYLQHKKQKWHVSVLTKIPKSTPTIAICRSLFDTQSIKYIVRSGQNSPYIPMDSDWETFLKTTSAKFRKQLRNKINKLQKAGEVKFDVCRDVGINREHLNDALSVSSRSWKHQEGTSMTSTPERKSFFELLSDIAAKNGWLRIWLLKLNGKSIATEYHLEYKGKTHAMRGDFSETYNGLSPGSILEAHIIEQCFRTGVLEYDFCGLPFGYKMRWTKLLHERSNLLFYNATPYSHILYWAQKYLPIMHRKYKALTKDFSCKRSLSLHVNL